MLRHPARTGWLTAGLAVVLLVAGVAAGMLKASGESPSAAGGEAGRLPLLARVPASRHSAVGIVRDVRPGEFVVRNARGADFVVRWGPASRFRAAGRAVRPAALHPGDRVLVLGNPMSDGALRASLVTILARPRLFAPGSGGISSGSLSPPGGGPPPDTQ